MSSDLVCGAEVDKENARFFSEYGNETFYFCSAECKRKFDDHPDQYIRERTEQQLSE